MASSITARLLRRRRHRPCRTARTTARGPVPGHEAVDAALRPAVHGPDEEVGGEWRRGMRRCKGWAGSVSLLLPMRQAPGLFRRCLGAGMRVVKPMTLMTMGQHWDQRGCWFPSALY